MLAEGFQCLTVHFEFGEFLPAIRDDEVFAIALAATEIEHETFAANRHDKTGETIPIHAAFAKNPRRDDDVRGTDIKPCAGVVEIHAAAELQSAGIRAERGAGLSLAAGAEQDDVTAGESVAFVEFGKPTRGPVGNKICAEQPGRVVQAAADDLLDAALMKINARTEHDARLVFCTGNSKREKQRGEI